MEVSGQLHDQAPLANAPNGEEIWWTPAPVWTRWWRKI